MECQELNIIAAGKEVYNEYKKKYGKALEIRLRAYSRTALGLFDIQNQRKLDSLIEKTLNYSWGVGWARIKSFNPIDSDFFSWISNFSVDIILILSAQKNIKKAFFLLKQKYETAFEVYAYSHLNKFHSNQNLSEKVDESLSRLWNNVWEKLKIFNPFEAAFYTWGIGILHYIVSTKPKKGDFSDAVSLDKQEEFFCESEKIQTRSAEEINVDSPDILYSKLYLGKEVLQNFFEDTGYPWQILCSAFIFMGWKPQRIIDEFSEKNLYEIYEIMKDEFISNSSRSSEELLEFFSPLQKMISIEIKDIILANDPKSRKSLESFLDLKAGKAVLNIFLSNNPAKNISDWNCRVIKRLRKKLV